MWHRDTDSADSGSRGLGPGQRSCACFGDLRAAIGVTARLGAGLGQCQCASGPSAPWDRRVKISAQFQSFGSHLQGSIWNSMFSKSAREFWVRAVSSKNIRPGAASAAEPEAGFLKCSPEWAQVAEDLERCPAAAAYPKASDLLYAPRLFFWRASYLSIEKHPKRQTTQFTSIQRCRAGSTP